MPPPDAPRSLAPKEHGAYGQLATPLLAALLAGTPHLAALAITVASALAFVAHEPLLVVLGLRGTRAAREDGARARRRLLTLGGAAVVLGAAGLALAPREVLLASLVPLVLSLVLGLFVVRGAERTTPGELVAAAGLSAAALPVGLAAGLSWASAASIWACFALGFGAATLGVRAVLPRASRAARGLGLAVPLGVAALLILPEARSLAPALPLLVASFAVALLRPAPKYLRKVGFSLVGASLVTLVWLVVAAELG